MKLEVGKHYKNRNGEVRFIKGKYCEDEADFPFLDDLGYSYMEDGSYIKTGTYPLDLIEEVEQCTCCGKFMGSKDKTYYWQDMPFCSMTCIGKSQEMADCVCCGEPFEKTELDDVYCTDECLYKGSGYTVTCPICQEEHKMTGKTIIQNNIVYHMCSDWCYQAALNCKNDTCDKCGEVVPLDNNELWVDNELLCEECYSGLQEIAERKGITLEDVKDLPKDRSFECLLEGEAVKSDNGKPKYDLIDPEFLRLIAEVFTFGAIKYSEKNYLQGKGLDPARVRNSLMRHYESYREGEWLDPESGKPHLAHLGCCVFMLFEIEQRKRKEG